MDIDPKDLEWAKKQADMVMSRLSKQFEFQEQMLNFIEEHQAVTHQLVLNLYEQLTMEFPDILKDYKFKSKDPRCGQDLT